MTNARKERDTQRCDEMKKLIIFPFRRDSHGGTKRKYLMAQNFRASRSHSSGVTVERAGGERRAFSRQMKRGQTADWPQRMEAASDRMAAAQLWRVARAEHTRAASAHWLIRRDER